MNTIYKYDKVYVVIRYGDTEFYDIYLKRDEAVLAADKQNESMKELSFYDPKSPKWKVLDLWEAIDSIKESIKDSRMMDEYYGRL